MFDRNDYFFSFTENAYGISIVANEKTIERDFLPALEAANCPDLDVPNGVFRVLQVDDEGGQELSGKRISEISEPLAEGRFSILYISTYQTDFVLVSEPKLYKVMQALRQCGFEIDQEYQNGEYSNIPFILEGDEDQEESRSLSPVDPTQFLLDINVLANDLQCVGLNRHHRSSWVHTVLKTLCFSDLVPNRNDTLHKRFCSFVNTNDDISLIADTHILDTFDECSLMKDQGAPGLRVIQVHFSGSNIERCGIVRHISKPLSIEAHINMFYLSTFMTANIIVSADDEQQSKERIPSLYKSDEMPSVDTKFHENAIINGSQDPLSPINKETSSFAKNTALSVDVGSKSGSEDKNIPL
ncbi:hypothetical protein [Parasitella parasitica]|uniref:CASTOR ACT domain-containing protein n=1 Tax=Parasitella parasitica TaxID=35722 RepID=A0A0B7NFV9_9FUNG|nr:hypothetical protein [Parasitella parasitica]